MTVPAPPRPQVDQAFMTFGQLCDMRGSDQPLVCDTAGAGQPTGGRIRMSWTNRADSGLDVTFTLTD